MIWRTSAGVGGTSSSEAKAAAICSAMSAWVSIRVPSMSNMMSCIASLRFRPAEDHKSRGVSRPARVDGYMPAAKQ